MLYRGYFLAIDDAHVKGLRSLRGDPARRAYLSTLEEQITDAESTDKAWYLLFNCFQNSRGVQDAPDLSATDLESLALLFLGAQRLHKADFFVINLISRKRVPHVADALSRVAPDSLKHRYLNVNQGWFHPGDYSGDEQQFAYCWHWLARIAAFFYRHRLGEKHVLFSSQYQ